MHVTEADDLALARARDPTYPLCIMHYTLLLVAYTVADGHNATRCREYCRVLCLSYTALVDYGDWGVVTKGLEKRVA